MKQEKSKKLLNIILLFVLLQPLLDILSRGAILGYIPRISTYIKPLFVFLLMGYLLLFHSPKKGRWIIYLTLFIILILGHTYILYRLFVSTDVIIHELRFMINILYMVSIFICLDILHFYCGNKEEMYKQIKKTIMYTFIIYFILYLIAILTNTSGLTYEIADKNKLGFKGWYDSGQILGHAYSIMLPLLMYVIMDPKKKWYERALIMLIFFISVSLIGTRVPYFITIIVSILYLVITIFIKLFNKTHKPNYFNITFMFLALIGMLFTYKYTPLKHNMDLNSKALGTAISTYDLKKESGYYETYTIDELKVMYPDKDIKVAAKYNNWSRESSEYLINMFESGKIHPSNMRKKQISYAAYKYKISDFIYKMFGLGFLNQYDSLALESDLTMAIFSFGILGFILFLILPLGEFILSTIFIIKNLKIVDFETYLLYMGLGIFFCISIYAGYTYIYTNFSIFLVLLIMMLKIKRDTLRTNLIKENKISFLMLHLGYGGIETAVINSANMLDKEYNIELISLYNLRNNQVSRINENISIKYLYNGEPNKEAFLNSLKNKKYFKTLFEGIKAIYILLLKRLLIIREICNSDSKYLISTRSEFSTLLSKYGSSANIKIAEEHRYHNNDIKYINTIKYKYYNIDYLFALTNTLYDDYKVFLKNNSHTKVYLVPNIIESIPNKKSTLDKKNLITVSRLDKGKKVDDIIKSFAKIDDKSWHLTILGDGVEYNNLLELINNLKLNNRINLAGYIKKEDLEKYYLDSSIFLMASLTEGLPMVLLEAMSYGIPCIAYETASGVKDIIKNDYNGYVISNRNEEEYIKCINKLIKNINLRKEFGNNAVNTAKKFTSNEILKIWQEILRSCK